MQQQQQPVGAPVIVNLFFEAKTIECKNFTSNINRATKVSGMPDLSQMMLRESIIFNFTEWLKT